jgi:hypothetical protein
MSQFMTVKGVVTRFKEVGIKVSDKTIYRWIDEGKIFRQEGIRRIGGILILTTEVDRVINEGEDF